LKVRDPLYFINAKQWSYRKSNQAGFQFKNIDVIAKVFSCVLVVTYSYM